MKRLGKEGGWEAAQCAAGESSTLYKARRWGGGQVGRAGDGHVRGGRAEADCSSGQLSRDAGRLQLRRAAYTRSALLTSASSYARFRSFVISVGNNRLFVAVDE